MATSAELAALSEDAYYAKTQLKSGKWISERQLQNITSSGLFFRVYRNTSSNERVLAFRGTEVTDWGDLIADAGIIRRKVSAQFLQAGNIFRDFSSANLTVTGHSLGGALAKYVVAMQGGNAVAFNAPGVKGMGGLTSKHPSAKIKNINAVFDAVSKVGNSYGETETIFVSSIPFFPDPLEPLLVAKVVIETGGLAKAVAVGGFLLSQHSISNLVEALQDKANAGANKYRPRRRYGPPGKGFYRRR